MIQINQENREIFSSLTNGSGVNITNIDKLDKFYATMMVEVKNDFEFSEIKIVCIYIVFLIS